MMSNMQLRTTVSASILVLSIATNLTKPLVKSADVGEYVFLHEETGGLIVLTTCPECELPISDITEAVYTDRSLDWLAQELSKVPVFPNI